MMTRGKSMINKKKNCLHSIDIESLEHSLSMPSISTETPQIIHIDRGRIVNHLGL